jgi:hypothetical protein
MDSDSVEPVNDELALLKQRAKMLGITFSNNIGIESLREKIKAKVESGVEAVNPSLPEAEPVVNPLEGAKPTAKPKSLREMLLQEEMKLVRLRITNLDPKKRDVPGEIYTIGNEYLGTVRKYVPFGEVTDEGYHVPYCIYKMLEAKQFLNIRTRKLPNGQTKVEQSWAKEFALEVLPPLTTEELSRLANAQAAAGVFADS